MKSIFSILLFTAFIFNSLPSAGQSVARQERENRAMSRLAKDQANSSNASKMLWGGLAVFIIGFGVWSMLKSANDKEKRQATRRVEYEKQQNEIAAKKIEEEQTNKEQTDKIRALVDKECLETPALKDSMQQAYNYLDNGNWTLALIEYTKVKENFKRFTTLFNKYGSEIGPKLYKGEVWLGMTEEELKDAKGEPTKVEVEQLVTKTKKIFIYGNKSSGDIFTFENGTMTKLLDR